MTEQGLPNGLGRFSRRFWYVGDLVVIGLLFAYITYVHSHCWISYNGGLHNKGAPAFVAGMFAGMLLPLAGIFLLILVFRLAVSWPRRMANRRRLWKLRGLVIGGLSLYAGLFFLPVFSSQDAFTLGLKKYAQSNVDVPTIQAWLKTVDPKDCMGDMLKIRVDALPDAEKAHWPEAIKSLKSGLVSLHLDSERRPVVRLEWGGWDEAWGVMVGSAEMETPKTKLMRGDVIWRHALYERGHYTRPLASGVYVWYNVY
jgi:hypothetical protein